MLLLSLFLVSLVSKLFLERNTKKQLGFTAGDSLTGCLGGRKTFYSTKKENSAAVLNHVCCVQGIGCSSWDLSTASFFVRTSQCWARNKSNKCVPGMQETLKHLYRIHCSNLSEYSFCMCFSFLCKGFHHSTTCFKHTYSQQDTLLNSAFNAIPIVDILKRSCHQVCFADHLIYRG